MVQAVSTASRAGVRWELCCAPRWGWNWLTGTCSTVGAAWLLLLTMTQHIQLPRNRNQHPQQIIRGL